MSAPAPGRRTSSDKGSSLTKGVEALKVKSSSTSSSTSSVTSPPAHKKNSSGGITSPSSSSSSSSSSSTSSSSSSSSSSSTASSTAPPQSTARRRLSIMGDKESDVHKLDGSSDPKSGTKQETESKSHGKNAAAARRRLSVMAATDSDHAELDGADKIKGGAATASVISASPKNIGGGSATKKRLFSHYATLSKVGFIPFNPNKVNQDRAVEVVKFGGSDEKALFGVFDGHGALGHEVSQFLITHLPRVLAAQSNLDSNPIEALTKTFVDTNTKLATTSGTDCTFSGSTGIVVYLQNGKIYSANAGDSRAVLARSSSSSSSTASHTYQAVALSSDQKPERPDEKKRILEHKGRVEACKGPRGEDIGPLRVWLANQDVPGLAMSRSFGDLIAASVGVIPKPEVWERDAGPEDKFFILASDGVWEFISNQEAVDLVGRVAGPNGANAEEAVRQLCEEAVKRWRAEEEVVDDITAVIVWL